MRANALIACQFQDSEGAWEVCPPSSLARLSAKHSVFVCCRLGRDACCGRLHEKCCVAALYCTVWKSRPPSLQVCGQTFGTSLWPVLSPVRFTSQAKKKLIPCLLCGMKSLVSFFIFARPCSESVVMPRPLARVCGLYCR